MVADNCATLLQQVDDVDGRAFAHVADVRFVGHAQNQDAAAFHGFVFIVEGQGHFLHHVVGHVAVHVVGQLNEAGGVVERAQLPAQVVGVDGDAVAAQAGAGVERHETVGLGGGRADDFPHVQAQLVAHEGDLVDQADVHGAEGVFQQFHHFGGGSAGDGHRLVNDGAVQGQGDFQAVGGDAADDFGGVEHVVIDPAGVDTLR